MTDSVVRHATESDIPALNGIYNRYIVNSHVSFDVEPWGDEKRAAWFEERSASGYPVFVAERSGAVVGASWAGPWRDKAAYRSTVETTVVLDPDVTGQGLGSALLQALVEDLSARGFHRAIAIVALPNDASLAVHRRLGYTDVGVLDEAGFKDGRFVSTMLMQRHL